MKIKTILAFIIIIVSPFAYSQNKDLEWINVNAIPLGSVKNFSFLDSELNNNTIIGLGEASHGT
ncbi:MAG: hypothetical protein DI548_08585, partial [Flavobacterium johnsoniae]